MNYNKLPAEKLRAGIIAIDLDDTLLKEDLSISDYTVSVLQRAADAGIYVTLCSGRTDNAILPYVRRLDLAGKEQGRYIIAQNGASVSDLHTRREIFSRTVDPELLIYAHRAAAERGMFSEVYDASTIYVPADNEWTQTDVKLSGLKMQVVPEYEALLGKGHPKMVIPGDPAEIQLLQAALKAAIGDKCVIFTSKPYFLEILPYNCGKGEALEWLSDRLAIPRSRTMSFGDSMNDESMIRYAEQSVAMCNGLDAIKELARYVTEYSHNEDGLARFIEKYVL
ncbi:Cof-type HAD-IIB family hydrolase [Treponema brennaborense]|uniref:Cof-like hydrolase n=1 Tax=Treponema brennaborense (strain DSM 12168 / CIP 105900 / DD5/3) TaxID=906968 RepID=F4LMX8_TREBD|nr:Cof-type HAD-IIB family hydrolase [Treponema brennaborense]AEE15764.1 Cof-like hydrolase [Treponema brennaborense DSM 12168]